MGKPVVKETYVNVEEFWQKLLGTICPVDDGQLLVPVEAIRNAIATSTQLVSYGSDAEI